MDNQRVFVWAALALVLWLNYMAWQTDYAPRPEPAASTLGEPVDENAELPEVPSAVGEDPAPTTQLEQRTQAAAQADIIRVTTDVLSLDISTRGGELVRADLPRYPRDRKQPDVPVRLFDSQPPGIFVARSGLRALGRASEPTHQAIFEADATEYSLAEGADELVVPLKWTDGQGVTVTKTYTFRSGTKATEPICSMRSTPRRTPISKQPRMCSSYATTSQPSVHSLGSKLMPIVDRRFTTARHIDGSISKMRRTASTRARSPAAGSLRFSIISWLRRCRRQTLRTTTRSGSIATTISRCRM